MRPTFEELSALVAVVEAGGVTAAALRLRTTKSVISKRLSTLEAKLNVALYRRSGPSMHLTEAGLLAYKTATGLLAGVDGLVEDAAGHSGELRGLIHVAGPRSFGNRYLNGVVTRFMRAHADVEIRLDLDDHFVDLLGAGFDFSIRIGRLSDSSFKARRLGESRRALFCAPSYARAHGLPASPDAFDRHVCLGYSNVPVGRHWSFVRERGSERISVKPECRLFASSGETLLQAAIDGVGLTPLPWFLTHEAVRANALVPVVMDGWTVPSETIHAVYPASIEQPRKVRALMDEIAQSLDPLPWEAPAGSS